MTVTRSGLLAVLLSASFGAPSTQAEVPAADAARLGKTLTPMGAEAAGSADKAIPPWTGGLTTAPAGYQGGHYADPYANEKPLFVIDVTNVDKYKDKLSPGQLAMLKKYQGYKLPVYPTHRTASFPKAHYDETVANATRVQLTNGGNGITGTKGGVAFPIPQNGQEAIWNHLTRYRGDTYAAHWSQAAVGRDGAYTPVRFEFEYDFHYGNLSKPDTAREDGKLFDFRQTVTAPARLAGNILLVHEYTDQVKNPRQAWTYNPGQRRVRLAPNVAYDNPGTATDGMRTNDDFVMFNGATDRYDWKLLGKREMFIPYNSYKLSGNTVKITDILKPLFINPELTRYELHRVWVVDATLKPGASHIYSRRTFYIDEDSWMVVAIDKYDSRGELYRTAEQHAINFSSIPMYYPTVEVHYDLSSGRYLAMGMRNEEPKVYVPIQKTTADFTPNGLRGAGTR
ncbi:MAG: DUF1329 domain-containing protein [Burkholderiaceae bacterium]